MLLRGFRDERRCAGQWSRTPQQLRISPVANKLNLEPPPTQPLALLAAFAAAHLEEDDAVAFITHDAHQVSIHFHRYHHSTKYHYCCILQLLLQQCTYMFCAVHHLGCRFHLPLNVTCLMRAYLKTTRRAVAELTHLGFMLMLACRNADLRLPMVLLLRSSCFGALACMSTRFVWQCSIVSSTNFPPCMQLAACSW